MTGRRSPILAFLPLALLLTLPASARAAPTERALHYEEALARAKATGNDLAVFQRGSDWNRLGETLYNEIWQTPGFVSELGDGFILVAVDRPEVVGGRAVQGQCTAVYCGTTGFSDTEVGSTAPLQLAKRTEEDAPLPPNQLVAVESGEGVAYRARRTDGAFLCETAKNPGQDTLNLSVRAPRGGRVLRLDFLTDTNLPGQGPGRASNGNFAISEVEARRGSEALHFAAAWANAAEGAWGAWQVVDGVADKGDNLWNPAAHHHKQRSLLLVLEKPLPPDALLNVRLVCRSQWGQHLPGCLRAAVLADEPLAETIVTVAAAQALAARNAKFSWWDRSYCPRIALMDSQGHAVAAENKPRLGLTAKTMAARIRELRAVREQRDATWAQAEKASGPAKAELLRRSLEALGFANWAGNENGYKFVHEAIRQADSNDVSGAVRWLSFGGHGRDGAPGMGDVAKARDAKNHEEALALVDRHLADPRNKALDHDRIQRILLAKYHIYRHWPGHEDQRFDVQREIARLDPTTYLGIGAIGYLGMHRRSDVPMITYGWGPGQIKAGAFSWDMTDTDYFFDHAGPYKITLAHAGGGDTVKVARIALIQNGKVLAEATTATKLGPGQKVEADLDLKDWRADGSQVLRLDLEAEAGKTNHTGNISIEPVFVPAAAARPPDAPAAEQLRQLLADADRIGTWQARLADELDAASRKEGDGLALALSAPPLRATVAKHELIRACTPEDLAEVARRQGGVAFLADLLNSGDWLESFLVSGPADRAQALENLRFLHRHATEMTSPVYQRLATAMALNVGTNHSRYRLADRFAHIKRAHKEGLLHAGFDRLDVREMRRAVYLPGTARDYQFLLDDRQTTVGDYFGACWAVPYRDPNDYGYSVQGWGYCDPWRWFYGAGLGSRPLAAQRQCGGVCGTLSEYGVAAATAHGVMATTVGQPGHCAYVVRAGEVWGIGNDVSGPWSTGWGVPGWDGTGYTVAAHLWEPVEADRERFLAATRLAWVARMQVDRAKARVRVLPGLRYSLYRGVGPALPDFAKIRPGTNGVADGISLADARPPNENYALVWEGRIEVSGSGPVRVSTHSDDQSRVIIAGEKIVEANCSKQEKTVQLGGGLHALRVEFAQGAGDRHLAVAFEGVPVARDWPASYERAMAEQPLNYGTWIEYVKALEAVTSTPAKTWISLGRAAARTFAAHPQAGWALADRCFERISPAMKPAERMAFLLVCHAEMRDEKILHRDYPYGSNLDRHADLIGDPAAAVAYFGRLLQLHHAKDARHNWCFGQVLAWGQRRFAGNPKTASLFAGALEGFFKAQGDAADRGLLANAISTGIRKASESGDVALFQQWNAMAAAMLPVPKPEDVHLNAKQAAARPPVPKFPGEVLSRGGVLQTSSQCPFDRPLSYRQVLDGTSDGWFDTNAEDKPWAQVRLAGDASLSGIVLVNRHEYAPGQDEFQWAVPLKVSVSTDGKAWTQVASFEKAEPVFRVDLQGSSPRARFVRIERAPGKPQARFHFRNLIVYGRRLY